MDHVWREVREAVSFSVFMSVFLLCATAGILIYLLRRLLAPLQELAAAAAAIRADSPSFQPPPSVMGVYELMPLADALSKSITRLRLTFEKEQRFISDAAHELKTAVAVVRSTIQLLTMRSRSSEEYQFGLEQALNDNQRVEELVSQMLTLARASERSEEALVNVDLGEEVASALKSIASFAEHRGVHVVPSLADDVKVQLPQNGVQILVSNLVMNAVQHSVNGSEVLVEVRPGANGEQRAVLEVRDFGSGIAPDNLPHVFERFFREDPSRSRETGGVGLGLAICKSIVESAGGAIELQSAQGRGTTAKASFRQA
jgi:signal transduction histidine kinase